LSLLARRVLKIYAKSYHCHKSNSAPPAERCLSNAAGYKHAGIGVLPISAANAERRRFHKALTVGFPVHIKFRTPNLEELP
jgi:hypothetical protein